MYPCFKNPVRLKSVNIQQVEPLLCSKLLAGQKKNRINNKNIWFKLSTFKSKEQSKSGKKDIAMNHIDKILMNVIKCFALIRTKMETSAEKEVSDLNNIVSKVLLEELTFCLFLNHTQ